MENNNNPYAMILANQRTEAKERKAARKEAISNFYQNWIETPLGGKEAVYAGAAGGLLAVPLGLVPLGFIAGAYLGKKERRQQAWKDFKKTWNKAYEIGSELITEEAEARRDDVLNGQNSGRMGYLAKPLERKEKSTNYRERFNSWLTVNEVRLEKGKRLLDLLEMYDGTGRLNTRA